MVPFWVLQKNCSLFTPPRNRGGVIFLLQFVCLSVSVCVCVSVNKIAAERMHQFGCGFRWIVAYCTGSNPIEIGDLGSKVKVTVTQYPFFLHSSLLTSLLFISALLYLIKLKFSMPLRYAICRFVFEFYKKKKLMVDESTFVSIYLLVGYRYRVRGI